MLFSILYEVFGLIMFVAILTAILFYPITLRCLFRIVFRVLWYFDGSDMYDSNGDYVARDH